MKHFYSKLALILILVFSFNAKAENLDKPIVVNGSQVLIEFQGYFSAEHKTMLIKWIKEMSKAVAGVYGELPLKTVKVKLVRSYSWFEPVPWGEVDRGNQSQVILHVNPNFSLDRISSDWTAAHEISHLLLPYVGRDNKWFSEGLASYYQSIARGKAGLINERQVFQKLFHGFRRGERNAQRKPVKLSEASSRGGSNMRVYWSGAVYFLNVDLILRQESKGTQSLGSVLKAYKGCCLPNHRVTPIWRVMDKLDDLSGTQIFNQEYEKIINSKNFPDYQESFEYLGITRGWGGIKLNSKPEFKARRKQLLSAN